MKTEVIRNPFNNNKIIITCMNLEWVPFANIFGLISKIVIPKYFVLPILLGPLKGKKWDLSSGVLEYYLGSYESNKVRLFQKYIKEKMVIYDIGAHVGYFSLIAATIAKKGQVISFEPNLRNIEYLKRHIEINRCSNVVIKDIAVSDNNGTTFFNIGKSSFLGKISKEGNIKVVTRSIDSMVESGEIPSPNFIKIDVEGHEMNVLKGSYNTLRIFKPMISLDTHGNDLKNKCITFLSSYGYSIEPETGNNGEYDTRLFAYNSG